MKQNILKKKRLLCVPALVLSIFLASCTDELSSEVVQGGGGKGEESEVTLRLQVPAAGGGSQTRAVDDATENTVNDLYILAFKAGKDGETFDYYVTASKTATATEWTANLRVRQEQQTFVMVANAQGTPGKVNEQIAALAAGSVGHKKDDVLAKLTDALTAAEQTAGFNAAATTNHHPFTMYGQTATTVITADAGIRLDVRMHRIVARVQVSFTGDAAGTKFTPQEVSLYNYNDRARVIPDKLTETVDDKYEADPTIPAGAVRLPATVDGKQVVPTYTVDADQKIEHQIYLFETAQPVGGTPEEQHVKRPCLIVKGLYDGATTPCYYRIDFFGEKTAGSGVKEYMEIVRNHSYKVTVQGVLAPGHDTPEEALTAQAANITATVVQWNDDDIGDIDFDGQHVLGIATMKYQLGKKGSNNAHLLQQVKASVGLKWTANLYALDDHGKVDTNTTPDWISFEGGAKEDTGTGDNRLQDLKFTVEKNDITPERRAVMRFTARNLMVEALVVQDQSDPVYINVKIGDRIITEAEFSQLGGWCPEMTIEFGPEGTELTWKAYSSNGIDLKNAKVGGTAQGTLNGTVAASNDPAGQTITWQAEAGVLNKTFDYGSSTGVLTLIARGKKGVASKAVKLVQTKYGVALNSNFIPCTGDKYEIEVTGNMNWVVAPVRAADQDGDSGYEDAVGCGLLKEYTANESGYPSNVPSWGNVVTLETLLPNDYTTRYNVKLRFTDQEKNISVDKTLATMPGIEIDGALYALHGPEALTPLDVNKGGYAPNTVPEGFVMASSHQASIIANKLNVQNVASTHTLAIRHWILAGEVNLSHVSTRPGEESPIYRVAGARSWVDVLWKPAVSYKWLSNSSGANIAWEGPNVIMTYNTWSNYTGYMYVRTMGDENLVSNGTTDAFEHPYLVLSFYAGLNKVDTWRELAQEINKNYANILVVDRDYSIGWDWGIKNDASFHNLIPALNTWANTTRWRYPDTGSTFWFQKVAFKQDKPSFQNGGAMLYSTGNDWQNFYRTLDLSTAQFKTVDAYYVRHIKDLN